MTDGKSSTVIEFWLEIDTDRALNDVKDAVTKIRTDLPRAIDEPIISRVDVENQPILTYSASSPTMTLEQLSWHVDDVVKRELQGLKGVGRIDRIGGVTREIRVSLDPDRLLALGVTAADVNRQLRATSVDLAGGKGEVGSQEQSIRTLAGTHTIEDLENTKIIAARRPRGAPQRPRQRHRRLCGADVLRAARRRHADRRLLDLSAPRAPATPRSPTRVSQRRSRRWRQPIRT